MTMLSLILSFLLWLTPAEFNGVVTTSYGETLPGVHVFPEGQSGGTVTDAEGRFRITVQQPEETVLVFSMVGFRRQFVPLRDADARTELRIVLEPITASSGEVVVTAGRRSQVSGTVPMSIAAVSAAGIESRNAVALDQVLRTVPGVQMAENQVGVRGSTGFAYGTGSRVLLLLDGVPLMGPDQNDIKLDALPMAMIERIEVLKGPGSALYGSGALGGVINLITKNFPDRPQTTAGLFQGFYEPVPYERWRGEWSGADEWRGYTGLSLSHARRVNDRLGFWVSGLYRDDAGYLESSNRRSLQTFGKLTYQTGSSTWLDVFAGYRFNRARQFLYWNGLNDPLRAGRILVGQDVAAGTNYVNSEVWSLLPAFRHVVSDHFFYHLRGRVYGTASRPLDAEGNVRDRENHTYTLRYGLEAETTWLPASGWQLISGLSFDGIQADSEFFLGDDGEPVRNQPEYALFSQAEFSPLRQLSFSAGLRFDAYEIDTQETASRLSPKLNAAWFPTEALSIRAAYGHGFRVPAVSERFVNNRDFLPLEPNLRLRPEESVGYELGITYVATAGPMALDFDLALFSNEFRNLIEPAFNLELGAFQFINLDRARIRGAEIGAQLSLPRSGYSLSLGYLLLDHRDTGLDAPLAYRSDHQLKATTELRLLPALTFGADFRYLTRPERVDSDFALFVRDAGEFPDIYVLDVRLSALIPLGETSGARTFVQVRNLLRHFYVERPAYLAETRTIEAGMQLRF